MDVGDKIVLSVVAFFFGLMIIMIDVKLDMVLEELDAIAIDLAINSEQK